MDVDVPSKDAIQFSASDTKGKRIVADLPVEAQDNLPWYGNCRIFQGPLLTLPGLRSTAQTPWTTSPDTRTS